MLSLLLGTGIFVIVLGVVNALLIKRLQFTYSKHFLLFSTLYTSSIFIVFWFVPELLQYANQWLGIVLFSTAALLFIYFNFLWGKHVDITTCYKYQEIPNHFKSILCLDARRGFAKVFEILLQQVCALFIIMGLIEIGLSVITTVLLFTGVVFALHITTPKWFGTVYGNYFLWVGTILAPLEVYFILEYSIGFYIASILHMAMYIVMYSMAYLLRDRG